MNKWKKVANSHWNLLKMRNCLPKKNIVRSDGWFKKSNNIFFLYHNYHWLFLFSLYFISLLKAFSLACVIFFINEITQILSFIDIFNVWHYFYCILYAWRWKWRAATVNDLLHLELSKLFFKTIVERFAFRF